MAVSSKPLIYMYPGPDIGPTKAFKKIAEAGQDDLDIRMLPGHDADEQTHAQVVDLAEKIARKAVLLIGFSHNYNPGGESTQHQVALVSAVVKHDLHPQIVFFEDLARVGTQYPNVVQAVGKFSTLLTAGKGYDTEGWARSVHIANPPHHADMAAGIRHGLGMKKDGNLKYRMYGTDEVGRPVTPDMHTVYVAGYKHPRAEIATILAVRAALEEVVGGEPCVLHYRPDPREKRIFRAQGKELELGRYDRLRHEALQGAFEFANPAFHDPEVKPGLNKNEMLMGAAEVNFTHPFSSTIAVIPGLRVPTVFNMEYKDASMDDSNYPDRALCSAAGVIAETSELAGRQIRHLFEEGGITQLIQRLKQTCEELTDGGDEAEKYVRWLAQQRRG